MMKIPKRATLIENTSEVMPEFNNNSDKNQQIVFSKLFKIIQDTKVVTKIISHLCSPTGKLHLQILSSLVDNDEAFKVKIFEITNDIYPSIDHSSKKQIVDQPTSNFADMSSRGTINANDLNERADTDKENVHVGFTYHNQTEIADPSQNLALVPLPISADEALSFLQPNVLKSIEQWWKNEISGKRCLKNCIVSSPKTAYGFLGAMYGATIGTCVNVGVGSLLGAIVGGVAGAYKGEQMQKWLATQYFDLRPINALENAYEYMYLKETCTDAQLESRYRDMARLLHPDREGSTEDFQKLQYSLAIIKQARKHN